MDSRDEQTPTPTVVRTVPRIMTTLMNATTTTPQSNTTTGHPVTIASCNITNTTVPPVLPGQGEYLASVLTVFCAIEAVIIIGLILILVAVLFRKHLLCREETKTKSPEAFELQDKHSYQHLLFATTALPLGGNWENQDPKLQPAQLRAVIEQMTAQQRSQGKAPLRPQKPQEQHYVNLPDPEARVDDEVYEDC